jgi:hypothetical protein
MIPQQTLRAIGNLCGSERQATGVRAEQDINLILSDEALGQDATLLRVTRIVVRRQA